MAPRIIKSVYSCEFICNNAVFRDADREKMLFNLIPIDVSDKLQVME